jgi:hypothetical protein
VRPYAPALEHGRVGVHLSVGREQHLPRDLARLSDEAVERRAVVVRERGQRRERLDAEDLVEEEVDRAVADQGVGAGEGSSTLPYPCERCSHPGMNDPRRWTAVVTMVMLTGLAGCDALKDLKKAKEELVGSGKPKDSAPDGPLSDDPDTALGLKLNHPIECINFASAQVARSEGRYFSWTSKKDGPVGNEKIVYGLFEVNKSFVDRCKKALEEYRKVKEPPTTDLDGLLVTYEAKLDAVAQSIAEAHKYYDQKDYQDDKFAKAKTMHPGLVKAFEEFDAADQAVRKKLDELKSGMTEREIAKLEKSEGKKLRWHKLKIGVAAERVVVAANVPMEQIDLAKLEAATKELEDIVGQLETYEKANAAEVSKVLLWSSFSSKPVELIKATKALLRRVRDKKPFADSEKMMIDSGSGRMIEGHPDQVLEKYNDLVKAGNSLRF